MSKQTEMGSSLKPLNVSPFIKGLRWSLFALGIVCGMIKLKAYESLERMLRPKRELQIKEKYERLRREGALKDSKELHTVGQEFEIDEFPPGWDSEL